MNNEPLPTTEQFPAPAPAQPPAKRQPLRRRTRIIIAAAAVLLLAVGVILFIALYLTPQANKAAREYKTAVATQLGDYIFAENNQKQYDAIKSTPQLQKPLGAPQLSAEYRDAQNIQKSYDAVINDARVAGKELVAYSTAAKLPTTLSGVFSKSYDIGQPVDYLDTGANRQKNAELLKQVRAKATDIHTQAETIKSLGVADKYKSTLNGLGTNLQSMADILNQFVDGKEKQLADFDKNTQERKDITEQLKQTNSPEQKAALQKKLSESQAAGTKLLTEGIDLNAKNKTLASEYGNLSNKIVPDIRTLFAEFKQDDYVNTVDKQRDAAVKRVDEVYKPITTFDTKAKIKN